MSAKINMLALRACSVLDEEGKKIPIANLWEKQAVIIIFLRHFACIACRAHAVQVWSQRELYEKSGARIVFISNGAPNFIAGFKEELGLNEAAIYTDPSLESFKACGFERGFLKALGPKGIVNGLKLMAGGHKQGEMRAGVGDLWQLGGVVAIKPGHKLAFHFISEATGDYPLEADIRSIPW